MRLLQFYENCYQCKACDSLYLELVEDVLNTDHTLDEEDKRALRSGDSFRIRTRTNNSPKLKAFLKSVYDDKSGAFANLEKFYDRMIKAYGANLSDEQKKAIKSGDANIICGMISSEDPHVTQAASFIWTVGAAEVDAPDAGHPVDAAAPGGP